VLVAAACPGLGRYPDRSVDHDAIDHRIAGEPGLEVGGRDVLAAGGDQDVLLAIDDL
jgi:hypothetical protein